ncbi:MAG TPA: MAPEG family protein [Pelomicrobium sp.]|nr:MAPEG family protein [Pelomicrobium sp.]
MTVVAKVALLYASLNAFVYLGLSWRVVRLRRRYKVGIGYNGKQDLNRAIRVHANFAEYVPLALVLLFGLELAGIGSGALHGLGAMLVLGRLLHAYSLSRDAGQSRGRSLGTGLTWLMIGASAALGVAAAAGALP